MRACVLLIFISICSAQYSEPPIDQVMDNNTALAPSLEGAYNETFAVNGTVNITFDEYVQPQYLNASLDIAGLNLMIDNATSPVEGLAVLIARGHSMTHLTSLPAEGFGLFVCDRAWFEGTPPYPWRCDFEEDDCVEYENATGATYGLDAVFAFRNVSATAAVNSTLTEVPEVVLEEMRKSSGLENLSVNISGNVTFFYQINDRYPSFDCADNETWVNRTLVVSANRSFRVEGQNKLFFLRSPLLREQWFRNNDFNVIVLSQSRLRHADLYQDGVKVKNHSIRTFYVVSGPYGIAEIRSNFTNGTDYSEGGSNVTTPLPLEMENHSFLYVYEFNYSYSGIGRKNFSLLVSDSFGGNATFSDNVTSRMLSYGGAYSEDGSPAGSSSRPSAGFEKETLARITVAFGLIALVIFLAFFNFWSR